MANLTPEALYELVERLRARCECSAIAGGGLITNPRPCVRCEAADAIGALRKEREAYEQFDRDSLINGINIARDLERERCAMLAEMAGQMDLAKQIRTKS